MTHIFRRTLACICTAIWIAIGTAAALAQTPATPAQLERRIEAIAAALDNTQQQLQQSQQTIVELQKEILQLRQQTASVKAAESTPAEPAPATASMEERQQTIEAAVKLHDQTKVESTSKYPVRLTGLILMNAYLNRGVPDNTDLPAVALRPTTTSGSGSTGASFRQTVLGLEADGPRIAGARTSASINFDFFSGLTYTNYGTSAGVVRMRTASINFDWPHDSVELGLVAPLISPLSPTSYATVGEPSLASAGNLWTWAPQLRYSHRQKLANDKHMQYELGLWDPPSAGYNSNQLFRNATPGELSQQPALETRVSFGGAGDRSLQVGAGGYYSRQSYPGYAGTSEAGHLNAWVATLDWRVPFARRMELSGEAYRGRGIGGLGGGVYKDIIAGTSAATGTAQIQGLNAAGGWTQLKARFTPTLESNIMAGQDGGFASDFRAVVLSPAATQAQLRARNRMVGTNFIYRPKTYIIVSPEFRRVWTWPITGQANTINVFTLSLGYQF